MVEHPYKLGAVNRLAPRFVEENEKRTDLEAAGERNNQNEETRWPSEDGKAPSDRRSCG